MKYKRSKSVDENPKNINKKCEIQKSFDTIISEINLTENGYSLSEIRDRVNALLSSDFLIENRKVKELLIEKYEEDICFTYPRDRTKSQMFYSRLISSESFVETIRSKCANTLKEECLSFNFELSNTFCDADNLDKSYEYLENNIPESWDLFFKNLFNSYNKSGHQKRKALTIFQIACYNINTDTIKTPLHVSIGQTVHEISRSKQLIQILNRLGICMSYDEIER